MHKLNGYGVAPRRPLLPLGEREGEVFMEVLKELMVLEAELEAEAVH